MRSPLLLALDPSFTATGWVIVDLRGDGRVISAGLVRTKPAKARERLSAAEDGARRGAKIRRAVSQALLAHDCMLAAQEGNAGSKSAKSAAALARAQQACVDAADSCLGALPILVTPQHVKQVVCGSESASKDDLKAAALERWAGIEDAIAELIVRDKLRGRGDEEPKVIENVYDAACVAESVWDRPDVVAIRRFTRGGA